MSMGNLYIGLKRMSPCDYSILMKLGNISNDSRDTILNIMRILELPGYADSKKKKIFFLPCTLVFPNIFV